MSPTETKITLSHEQIRVYQQTLETAHRQLEEIDRKIEQELAEVRVRLAELRDRRKAVLQMVDAARTMLGIPNDNEADEEYRSESERSV